MGLTITISDKSVFGNKKVRTGTIAFDSSYPTGGEVYTAAQFALSKIKQLQVFPKSGYLFEDDATNKKLKVLGMNPTSTSSGVIALEEVANTTNLSTLTGVPFFISGYGG